MAKHSFEFKKKVVLEYMEGGGGTAYLSNEVSYQQLALSQGINNPAILTKWVNDFRTAGPDALRPKKKGRKKTLNLKDINKNSTMSKTDDIAVDTSAEHVRELEDELLKLRIENA